MTEAFELEYASDRESAAAILHGLAEGVAAGAVQLEADGEEWTVDVPQTFDLELEFEAEEDERGLEVELEWSDGSAEGDQASEDEPEGTDAESEPSGVTEPAVRAAATNTDTGRFELFEDNRGEWRWRLVHSNGNVIATSGEGYTRKHNARKGLRSVMRNATGAVVTERTE